MDRPAKPIHGRTEPIHGEATAGGGRIRGHAALILLCLETKRMLRVRPCHENAEIDILPSYLHPISYHKVGNV